MGTRVTAFTVAATVVCALGIGLYMQKSADLQQGTLRTPSRQPPQVPAEPVSSGLVLQDLTFTSVGPSAKEAALHRPPQSEIQSPVCNAQMQLLAMPEAMMQVEIVAPCHAGERFTLHHGGLMITQVLDRSGQYSGPLPALTEHPVVIADFARGRDLEARTRVSGLNDVLRVALHWQGTSGLEVHALEFGASYGEAGHVWHDAVPGMGAGEVLTLGDPDQVASHLAQIYSLPRDQGRTSQTEVTVSIEAEITSENCDQVVNAELFDRRDSSLRVRDLTLTMPDCSAIGDFLVLNNLVETLRLAAN